MSVPKNRLTKLLHKLKKSEPKMEIAKNTPVTLAAATVTTSSNISTVTTNNTDSSTKPSTITTTTSSVPTRNAHTTELVNTALEHLQLYIVSMSEMCEIGRKFIHTSNELKSLKKIRRQLSVNSTSSSFEIQGNSSKATDRYSLIEENIPSVLKCPVCMEVYEGQVLQCKNGHSCCSVCVNGISRCPECRVFYTEAKIRNRAVEELMRTLKLECPYNGAGCREKRIYKEIQLHADTCPFMNKPVRSQEYRNARMQLKTLNGQAKRLEKRLQEANGVLRDTRQAWTTARDNLLAEEMDSAWALESLNKSSEEFQLLHRENEMMSLYLDLNQLITHL